jgi:predicted nucleic acid-binding protein
MTKAVIDASVALKWLMDDEECVGQAVALRDDGFKAAKVLYAPTLLFYEAINGLVVASRRGRLPEREIPDALEDLLAVGVTMRTPDHRLVTTAALVHRLSAYDGAYLALAEQEDCELWTGDQALYRNVGGAMKRVRWIGDYA